MSKDNTKNNSMEDKVISPETAPSPTGEVPQSSNKTIILILSIAVIIASSLAGIFYWQNSRLKSELMRNMAMDNTEEQPIETPTTSVDPTTNWSTIVNTTHGYQFDYPENWSIMTTFEDSIDGCETESTTTDSEIIVLSETELGSCGFTGE